MPRGGLQGGRVSSSLNVKNSSNAAKVMIDVVHLFY